MRHELAASYAGAVADGELDSVPAAARTHIETCGVCAREVSWQREVNSALASSLAIEVIGRPTLVAQSEPRRRPLPRGVLIAGIAAAVLLVAAVGVLFRARPGSGPATQSSADAVMTAAAQAFGAPPAMATSDSAEVARWTAAHGMSAMRPPAVTGATLVGVRAGSAGGWSTVTFLYADRAGPTEVTAMLDRPPLDWPMSETRMMGGRAVGMVQHGTTGMVVVAPDREALRRAMTAVE